MLLATFTALAYRSGKFTVASRSSDRTSSCFRSRSTAAKFSSELVVTMMELE